MSAWTILITGADGLLGTALRATAPENGDRYIFSTRREADLEDQRATENYLKETRPDAIIHAAAVVGGIRYNMDFPEELRDRNNRINDHLLQAAYQLGVRKVVSFLSTCIFPADAPEPWDESMIHHGAPDPRQWGYAEAKRNLDKLSRHYTEKAAGRSIFVTLIPSSLYGPNDNFDAGRSHVFPAIVRKIKTAKLQGIEPTFWGAGAIRREFLFSEDMARAAYWAVKHYASPEPLLVSPGSDEEIRSTVEKVSKALNYSGPVHWDTTQPEGRLTRRTNASRFRAACPNFEFTPFATGIQRTITDVEQRFPRLRGWDATLEIQSTLESRGVR